MFFATASHDFRQRLHAVKLLSRSAMHDSYAMHQENEPLCRLVAAVDDVDHYITELLGFACLEAMIPSPERLPVNLQRVFHELDLNFDEVALVANVNLVIRVTDLVLHTDVSMLQRILENLLSNAIKFAQGRRVLMAARRRSGAVVIEIWDQGPGIVLNNQAAIFTPFYQSPGHEGRGGVGLGLAVVKRFVDCLGYEITVRSRIGHGTVMMVRVPASDVQKTIRDGD